MKQIVKGHVIDLDYGGYQKVCQLLPKIVKNTIGKDVALDFELRKDKANGLYYMFATCEGGYSSDPRRNFIEIVDEASAREIAAEYLAYNDFKEFFADPEGPDADLKRRAADAEKRAESEKSNREYWYSEHNRIEKKFEEAKAAGETKDGTIAQLKSEIEDLKAKLAEKADFQM